MSLSRKELDKINCDCNVPEHNHSMVSLHPPCHPRAGMRICYARIEGVLFIDCAKCGEPICAIAVAAELPPELARLGDQVQ